MTFLKKNIENSPCNKQVKMMQKVCKRMNPTRRPGNKQINSICKNATNELKQCVSMTKRNYDYMGFWTRFDGTDNPL